MAGSGLKAPLTSLAARALLGLTVVQVAGGAVTNLSSSADTTLSENWPGNNLGGLAFVNGGTTQNFTRNRGLYKFDVAGAIPPGSLITTASLVLEMTHAPQDGYHFADFSLRRVFVDWGEGNKVTPTNSANAGTGSPATTNEATWYYRFAYTTNLWTIPGGAVTSDYSPIRSSSQTIYGLGDSPYTFGSTPAMVSDVQFWLDHPQSNFGWMLLCEAEATDFTARRFGSREDPGFPPQLEIQYLIAPRIDRVQRSGNQFNLSFTAQPGQAYAMEFLDSLALGQWQTLANIGSFTEVTRVLVVDTISTPRRFYRVFTY